MRRRPQDDSGGTPPKDTRSTGTAPNDPEPTGGSHPAPRSRRPSARALLWGLAGLLLVLGVAGGLLLTRPGLRSGAGSEAGGPPSEPSDARPQDQAPSVERIASLSPAITDSISALGAASRLVAVSDYCTGHPDLPRAGTGITPGFETLAKQRPTLILMTEVAGRQTERLDEIAPTHSLKWLTVPEVGASLVKLGRWVGRPQEAIRLAGELEDQLGGPPPQAGPRVLLALDVGSESSAEIWYVRPNSLHGALLHAAGARHAIQSRSVGAPKISVEQLLELDPEAIIVMRQAEPDPEEEAKISSRLRKLEPLTAVREGRIAVLAHPNLLSMGPEVLDHIEPLQAIIDEWFPPLETVTGAGAAAQ